MAEPNPDDPLMADIVSSVCVCVCTCVCVCVCVVSVVFLSIYTLKLDAHFLLTYKCLSTHYHIGISS